MVDAHGLDIKTGSLLILAQDSGQIPLMICVSRANSQRFYGCMVVDHPAKHRDWISEINQPRRRAIPGHLLCNVHQYRSALDREESPVGRKVVRRNEPMPVAGLGPQLK